MIDKQIFLRQMALLADRIGRPLAGPTQREYYRLLSEVLTTEQFTAAMTLAFAKWTGEYRVWPSPQQIVELIAPVSEPSLSAAEAFEEVLDIWTRGNDELSRRRERTQQLGASTMRAFLAAGGARDFANVLEADVVWLRRRFVEAYQHASEHADAERNATLALVAADEKVQQLVRDIASAKEIKAPERRRIAAQ